MPKMKYSKNSSKNFPKGTPRRQKEQDKVDGLKQKSTHDLKSIK